MAAAAAASRDGRRDVPQTQQIASFVARNDSRGRPTPLLPGGRIASQDARDSCGDRHGVGARRRRRRRHRRRRRRGRIGGVAGGGTLLRRRDAGGRPLLWRRPGIVPAAAAGASAPGPTRGLAHQYFLSSLSFLSFLSIHRVSAESAVSCAPLMRSVRSAPLGPLRPVRAPGRDARVRPCGPTVPRRHHSARTRP